MWDADKVTRVLVNPVYTVSIHPDLEGEHEPIVSKAEWIDANCRLIEEVGAKAWLVGLLEVLEGHFPREHDGELLSSERVDD